MNIAVTGSIATDHLMTFPGRFVDALIPDKLDALSVSFLVDGLEVRRGGVGANIAFGMGMLGLRPTLVGAVGSDFADYDAWLVRHGVDTASVHRSADLHTARFVCTTDLNASQIASFYPGAMSLARDIELAPVADRLGGLDLVVVGPNDPEAMKRHTAECRSRGIAFAADPSQQLSSMDGSDVIELIDGATFLFTNEYEAALTESKTGWSAEQILASVDTRITTLGSKGARIETQGEPTVEVAVPQERAKADPTGVGDAFRAGYLSAHAWGLAPQRCAEVGSLLATYVVETVGTQEYSFTAEEFIERFSEAYGDAAAHDIAPHLNAG
jgi:adenosine kinase